jgi:hypothetical protein
MRIMALNGTSAVYPMNGTSAVYPMQGTSAVYPMQGTSAVYPMNGADDEYFYELSVPMQGTKGQYFVHPLAAMTADQVPMGNVPYDATPEEMDLYRIAYMTGDAAAVNGLFSHWREARAARRAEKAQDRALRREKKQKGTRFIDKFGNALTNVSEGLQKKLEAEAALNEQGIEPNDEILAQRSLMSTDKKSLFAGSGLGAMWASWTPVQKGAAVVGGAVLLNGIVNMVQGKDFFAMPFSKKSRKRSRR